MTTEIKHNLDSYMSNFHDCPSCRSNDTSSLRMAWSNGTRHSYSSTVGVGLGTGGIGVGKATTKGFSQSVTSQALAPPELQLPIDPYLSTFWLILPWGLLSYWFSTMQEGWILPAIEAFFIMLIPACLNFKSSAAIFHKAQRENQKVMDRYDGTWICLRCGQQFQPR